MVISFITLGQPVDLSMGDVFVLQFILTVDEIPKYPKTDYRNVITIHVFVQCYREEMT